VQRLKFIFIYFGRFRKRINCGAIASSFGYGSSLSRIAWCMQSMRLKRQPPVWSALVAVCSAN